MNTQELIAEFRREYPDAKIAVENEGREIIAELGTIGEEGMPAGRALAWIELSAPHFHVQSTETYIVHKGRLLLVVAGLGFILDAGEKRVVPSGQVHHARGLGGPALVEVLSVPPWQPTDHYVV